MKQTSKSNGQHFHQKQKNGGFKMKKFFKITLTVCVCLAILMIASAAIPFTVSAETKESFPQTLEVGYSIHDIADNTGYYPSESNKVSELSSGHTKLGTLSVTGNVTKKNFNGTEAYAVYGDNLRFSYKQTWSNKTKNGHTWLLNDDSATSISGFSTGTIGNGGFLVLKSTDGKNWQKTGATSVAINGKTVTFSPDGADIKAGVYYKFISVCEAYYVYQSGSVTRYPTYGDAPWYLHLNPAAVGIWILANGWQEPVYSNYYQNFAQVSIVYVASDSAEVGFYSQAVESLDVPTLEDVSVENLEIIKKGTTLTDRSVSFDQIRLDKLGNTSFDVTCSYNDGKAFAVADGRVFRDPGHYRFVIKTKFGTKKETDLWILHPGDDMAYSQYFGDSFVSQDKRMFDKTSTLPVYAVGSALNIAPAENVPGLTGNIYRFADASAVENDQYEVFYTFNWQTEKISIPLDEPGIYCADLYTGDPACCGEYIHYGFYLMVSPSDGYRPAINYELLASADRHVMLQTSAYAVNFPTAGGGSYVFMFPATEAGYEAALSFSEEAELRFVEEYDQNGAKYFYYKAHGTSGLKEFFSSKIELQEAIYQYAQANVNLTHVISTEAYATMTLDEAVANIENTSLRKDVRVCVDAKTRNALLASTIVLNGYSFQQVAAYESDSVVAITEDGATYNIPYDTDISTILPATGKYTILESNWNGVHEYNAVFFASSDVTGQIELSVYNGFDIFNGTLSSSTPDIIQGYKVVLLSGTDPYDSETIVTIETIGKRTVILLSEIDSLTIDEPGEYTITIVNRCGYSTATKIKITEPPKVTIHFNGYEEWNRTVIYGDSFGALPVADQFGSFFLGWITTNGVFVTEATICDCKQNDIFLTPLFQAQEVEVAFSYFEGFDKIQSEYGATIHLQTMENIEDLFAFAYWELDGQAVEDEMLTISTLNNITLVAKYYRIVDGLPVKTISYTASEVPLLMKQQILSPVLADDIKTDDAQIQVDEDEERNVGQLEFDTFSTDDEGKNVQFEKIVTTSQGETPVTQQAHNDTLFVIVFAVMSIILFVALSAVAIRRSKR